MFTGSKKNSTLSIAGGSYSTQVSGDDVIVTVGDGNITLVGTASLGSNLHIKFKETVESNSWRISGTTATYGTATNTLITVNGVKSLDGLSLSGKVVTVSKSSLGTDKVAISGDGYTLKLGSDVTAPTTTAGKWTLSSTTATYKSASNTAGYTLANDSKSISYTAATSATTLTTVKGVKSTGGLAIDTASKTVTVSAASLNKKTVTISNGYTLKLAADVDTIKEDLTAWTTLDSGNVAYVAGGTGDYYALSGSNKITYYKSVAGTNKVELSGVKGTPSLSGNTVSLTSDNFASNVSVVSNAGGYTFTILVDDKMFTGSAGDDEVYNYGNRVTINAGTGNDSIYNNWDFETNTPYDDDYGDVLFKYASGDGNDIIYGFLADSTLSISGGEYIRSTVDNDIIITVGGGEITLVGAKSLSTVNIAGTEKVTVDPLNIVGKATADTISNSLAGATIQALGGNDKITNSGKNVSILGGAGNDSIKNAASKVSIVGDSGKDTIVNSGASVTVDSGADNDKISNTGAKVSIFGGAGNDSIKNTAKTVTIIAGDGDDTIVNSKGASVSIDAGDGNDKISNTGTSVSIFGGAGNDSIKNTAAKATINAGAGDDTIINSGASVTVDSGNDNDTISNTGVSVSIIGGTGNDSIKNTASKVTITAGAGNDTITNSGANVFIKYASGDGNDLIEGFRADSTLQIGDGKGTYSTLDGGDDIILTVGDDSITLTGAASLDTLNIAGTKIDTVKPPDSSVIVDGKKVTLTEDYMEDRFALADGYSTIQTVDASAVQFGLEIIGNKLMNSLTGTQDDDTIDGGDGKDTIKGGAGNDSLIGGAGNDSLFGEDDDDTLSGGDGNDTLKGGAGDDVFVYTAGKDVITDYTPDEDIISLGAATFADVKATLKGSNAVLTIGKGTLTVNDVKGKTLTITDKDGHDTLIPFTTVTLTDEDESPFAAEAEDWKIDASKRTKVIQITGNAYDNVILGGTKNDTIYGDVGADTFIYKAGDGNDIIYGFDKYDVLQIDGKFSGSYKEVAGDARIVIGVGSTNDAITLRDYQTDTFNVNGETYVIHDGQLKNAKYV